MIAKKKKKPILKKKTKTKIKLHSIPSHVMDVIKAAIIYERTIAQTVRELRIKYPIMSTHSAGLALALTALTFPDNKTFASMISDINPKVLTDYRTIKPFIDDLVPSRRSMH